MDTLSLGLLILRLVVGLTLAAHGAQKLFGWADGPGFDRLSSGFDKQGLKPGWFWAGLAVVGEFGGGLSLATGFLTPLGAAGIVGAMFMAIVKTHWNNGFWNSKRGLEFPLSLLASAVALGFTGPGRFALDALFGIHLPAAALFVILAAIAVLVDVAGMLISRSAPAPQGARG
jgi:putative oxidoreductase